MNNLHPLFAAILAPYAPAESTPVPVICWLCNGKGETPMPSGHAKARCAMCAGTGRIWTERGE